VKPDTESGGIGTAWKWFSRLCQIILLMYYPMSGKTNAVDLSGY